MSTLRLGQKGCRPPYLATAIAFQEHHLSARSIGQSRRDRLTDWLL
jgi:hypothetical protein